MASRWGQLTISRRKIRIISEMSEGKRLAILDALKTYRMIPESTEYFEEAAE